MTKKTLSKVDLCHCEWESINVGITVMIIEFSKAKFNRLEYRSVYCDEWDTNDC